MQSDQLLLYTDAFSNIETDFGVYWMLEIMQSPTPQDLQNALNDGSIETANSETLKKYLILLSQNNGPFAPKQEYIVIGNTINSILMQRHIDNLNEKNALTQKLVIALTVASLLVGIPQIWFAYRADKRAETEQKTIAAQQQEQYKQSANSSPAPRPSAGQATKKQP